MADIVPLPVGIPVSEGFYGYSFGALGTDCSLQLFADSRAQADMAAALAVAEVERIEGKYSRYKQTSALSAINRAAGCGEAVAGQGRIAVVSAREQQPSLF